MKKMLFRLLLLFITLLSVSSSYATDYYSTVALGTGDDVTDVNNWSDVYGDQPISFGGSGNSPIDFSSGSDVFHIIDGDAMIASTAWTVLGSVIVHSSSAFDASGFNHSVIVDIEAGGLYTVTNTYSNLVFGTVDIAAEFHIAGTSASFLRYDLTYPNLYFDGSGTLTALTNNLNVNGSLFINGKTVNVSTTVARVVNIGGNLEILAGTFRVANNSASSTINITGDINISGGTFVGTASTGSPIINAVNFNQSGGTFTGVNATATTAAGNPVFNITGDFTKSSGTYNARSTVATTGSGFPTFVMSGSSKNISVNSFTTNAHNFTINSTIGLSSNFSVGKALTIGASGNLSINANTLTIGGGFTNSGTLTGGASSKITFNSTTSGATLPAITLNTLTVSSTGQTIALGGDVLATNVSITSGTLSIGANTLTLDGTISNSGTFTGGATSNVVIGTSAVGLSLPAVTLNNLTVNASTSSAGGAVTVNGTITLNTGTFNPANLLTLGTGANIVVVGGTLSGVPTFGTSVNVTYSGSGNNTADYELPSSSTVLNNITFAKSGGIVSLNHSITVNGTLTITSGSLNSAGFGIDAKGDWVNNSTYTASSNTVTFSGTGTQTLSGSSSPTFYGLTINKSSGTLALSNAITVSNTLSMTAGTLDNSGSNISLGNGANIIVDQGTIQATPSFGTTVNVTYTGTGDKTANNALPTGSTVLNNVTFGKTGTVTLGHAITVNGTFTISSGTLNTDATNNYAITLKGDWINNGTFTPNTSTTTFSSSGTQTISGSSSTAFGSLTVNKPTGSLVLGSPVSASGTVTLTAGTLDNTGSQITLGNGATIVKDAGLFQSTPTFGTTVNVQYTGNGSISVGNEMPTSSTVLNDVTFGKSGTVTLTNPMTVNGILTISSGILNTDGTSNFAIDAKGNWVNNGTFTVNNSPVTFSGTTAMSGSGSHDFAAVTVSGALTAPSALNISGNFTNNGTFTHNAGTVTLNGSSSSNLAGTQKTTFNNLLFSKSSGGVTITGDSVKIVTLASITSGTLTTNGKLVLTSTADNVYASLLDASTATPNGSVTGNIVFHRILNARGGTATNGNAAMYSSPFSDGTVSDFQSDTKNFFFLDAATATFTKATSTGQSLPQAVGFSRRGAKYGESLYLVGAPGNGNISPSLVTSASGTWNLVGNPYPSTIAWGSITKSNLGGSNAAYLYNGTSWNAITSGNISVGQGFEVLALTGANLQFTNTARNSTGASFLRVAQPEPKLSIHLKGLTGLKDESFVQLNESASDQFDVYVDAPKLFPTNSDCPGLALVKGKTKTVIYHLNPNSQTKKNIPIYTVVNRKGNYSISFEGVKELQGLNWYLFDKKTNSAQAIISDTSVFSVEIDLVDTARYELTTYDPSAIITSFSDSGVETSENINCFLRDKMLFLSNRSSEIPNNIVLFDLKGLKVFESTDIQKMNTGVSLNDLNTGIYLVRIATDKITITRKIVLE